MKQISCTVKKNLSDFIRSRVICDQTWTKVASLKWKNSGSSKQWKERVFFYGIHHNVWESTNKVETMVCQAQLIYCVFITGYMFRPIYKSSSGLLTRESVNAMHVGIPSCFTEIKYMKYIKCLCWSNR